MPTLTFAEAGEVVGILVVATLDVAEVGVEYAEALQDALYLRATPVGRPAPE